MKKLIQLFIAFMLVVLAISQSPQRATTLIVSEKVQSPKYIRTNSNNDSLLAGGGGAIAIKDINTDTLNLSHRIDAKLAIADTANKWLSKNTPFATVAKTGSYDDLTNKPTIPSAQVNADWNASTGLAQILNKPISMPASDVYDWAKAATKPTYAYSEITNTPSVITPSDTSVFVRKAGTQTITGQKTFSGSLVANGIESSAGGLFYGQWTPFPTSLGTYVANYVSPTYGARILAYDGTNYQDLKLGKLISGSNFQLHLNADGSSIFNGTITAANLSGTNNGDETLSSIKSKLGVASSSNDGYLSRENWSTFNNKQDALGYTPVNSTAVGSANGVAPLDASAKIPTTYLPSVVLGAMKYQGTYDASSGSYPASPAQGNYWVVSVAGTISSTSYKVGDWMAYNGSGWNKIDNQQTVSSVFGRTGAVSAVSGDYNTSQVTESGNLYYTDTRAQSAISLTTTGNSGAATKTGGTINVPNYTLAGLGGQSQLNGTGFVKASGTTISYDNSSYSLSTHNHYGVYEPVISAGTSAQYWRGDKTWQAMPTSLPASDVYSWAKAETKPTYAYSEITETPTIPTNNNQLTNGAGYITGNQTTTLSGDVTGSGTTAITTTLANSGVTAGTYNNSATSVTPIMVDSKGRVTGIGTAVTITPGWSSVTGKPTLVGTDGTNASGTWPISITGTAATISTTTTSSSGDYIIPIVPSGFSSNQNVYVNGSLKFDPSTSTLKATNFSGTAANATNWSGSSSLGSLAYQSPSGAAAGKVLTATDASGNCTWQTPSVDAKNVKTDVYTITGSVTLNPTDFTSNSIIYVNSSSAVTITLPANNLDEWWPLGNSIAICRMGTGAVTFAVGSFGSLSSMNSYKSIADVEGWVSLTHRGTISGEFHLVGDLSN